jgi:hypothetical protein
METELSEIGIDRRPRTGTSENGMSEVFLCVNDPDVTPRSVWVPFKVMAKQYDSVQAAMDDVAQFCPNAPYEIKFIGNSFYITKELGFAR